MKTILAFGSVAVFGALGLMFAGGCGSVESNGNSGSGSAQGGNTSSANGGSSAQGGGSASGGGSAQGGGSASGGGSAQGGGSASGGGSAQGGAGGNSSGSGGAPECLMDADCDLVNNCCDCAGVVAGETLPCGTQECLVPFCQPLEPPTVTPSCQVGQCVTTVDCDHTKVACDVPPPTCLPGSTPTHNGNGCWGPCAVATECQTVGSCSQCGSDEVCVTKATMLGPEVHCVTEPAACNGTPNCACMGGSVCVGAYDTCNDTAEGISCACIDC